MKDLDLNSLSLDMIYDRIFLSLELCSWVHLVGKDLLWNITLVTNILALLSVHQTILPKFITSSN